MTINSSNDDSNFEVRLSGAAQSGFAQPDVIELFVFDWNEAESAERRQELLSELCHTVETSGKVFGATIAETLHALGRQSLTRLLDNRAVEKALTDTELDAVATELKKSRHQ